MLGHKMAHCCLSIIIAVLITQLDLESHNDCGLGFDPTNTIFFQNNMEETLEMKKKTELSH